MATKYFSIRGQSLWAKLKEPDDYNGTRKYKIGVIPDGPEDWNTIKESGIKVRSKKDENGAEFITLNRPADPKVGADGNMFGGGRPLVVNPDKTELDRLIGNGSEVEVIFCTYDGKMGKGHRLETVVVHKLVPYERLDAEEGDRNFNGIPLPSQRPAAAPVAEDEVKGPVEPKNPF